MILEGRKWHQAAKENGYPLRGDMQREKVYLSKDRNGITVLMDADGKPMIWNVGK